jgi:hypothetical protein
LDEDEDEKNNDGDDELHDLGIDEESSSENEYNRK